jgi:uncharacterized protein YdeI (YjbR/CyaY-like superfamily)
MKPTFFATPADFRAWLAANHRTASELLVGFHKVGTGKASITWPQSVDQALCFGWIDGVRRSLGVEGYTIRFTPRRPTSIWSLVNVRRFAELEKQGHVRAAGRAAFARRTPERTGVYSAEQRKDLRLPPEHQQQFMANPAGWSFFQAQPPWYQRAATHWVVSAKKPETREKRLRLLIADSAQGLAIGPLRRPGAPASKTLGK